VPLQPEKKVSPSWQAAKKVAANLFEIYSHLFFGMPPENNVYLPKSDRLTFSRKGSATGNWNEKNKKKINIYITNRKLTQNLKYIINT